MIDYEKLKIAHQLAKHLPFQHCHIDCMVGSRPTYFHLIYEDKDGLVHTSEFDELDALINKLYLLHPPIYKVGDVVWYLHTVDYIPMRRTVTKVMQSRLYFLDDCTYWEEKLYPTREGVIRAQLEYWHNLLTEEYEQDPGAGDEEEN